MTMFHVVLVYNFHDTTQSVVSVVKMTSKAPTACFVGAYTKGMITGEIIKQDCAKKQESAREGLKAKEERR